MLVGDFLTRSFGQNPEKTAVVCGNLRVTYAELELQSNRLARALIDGGADRGDRVAVFLDNSVEAVVAIFGILKAGCVFVVINQTAKPDKLRFVLDDCAARALITQLRYFEAVAEDLERVESLSSIIVVGGASEVVSTSLPVLDYNDLDSSLPATCPRQSTIDADVAALIYTSGTTGFPKGVTVSHLNVVSAARSITEYLENVADDVIMNVLPLSFDYGLYQVLMSVKMGSTLVLETSFAYPFKVVETIHREGVTGFPGVPTVFAVLLQMTDVRPELFDSVRYLSNTAAALPPAHIRRLKSMFRNARIYSMYGLTECKRVSYLPPEELERRPTSVGKGMPNEQVFLVDDHGDPVPPGTVGELVVRGSNVMLGYWNRPEETEKVIRPGRYPWERVLYSGDLFTADDDGFLYFVARKDDIIKSRGEKVSPSEVERIIHELDEVKEAAVVGVDDSILGQAIKAIVVPTKGADLTEKDVRFHCARRLESFMVPQEVEFRESLPKTTSGKISRKDLERADEEARKRCR